MSLFQKIKFLLKSKNRHGVHSPFVYSLNDECFNDKTSYKEYSNLENQFPDMAFFLKKKRLRLFFRLFRYLNLKNYAIICQEEKYFSWENSQKYDLIFVANENKVSLEEIIETMHNHSLLIIQNIYEENQILWENIQNCSKIHVTIDTYRQGLAFLRKEQRKEHFTIRT